MKVIVFIDIEVLNSDETEIEHSMSELVHEDLINHVRYGVHVLADKKPQFKYTSGMTSAHTTEVKYDRLLATKETQ